MKSNKIERITCENERGDMYKILDFQLPTVFKKLGLFMSVVVFAFLFIYKFAGSDVLIVKNVLRTLLLFFLLLATLSKDKLEDEYIKYIRFQSFVLGFIISTSYSVVIPLLAIVIDFSFTQITGNGIVGFYEISAFEVLFIMLGIQLLCFETLKRFGRA